MCFFFSSRRRHTRYWRDWSSDVCSSDLCLMAWRRHRSAFVYGWAGFCASLLVGLHALVDFSLQIPAVTVTYLAVLAVGWGRERGGEGKGVELGGRRII